VQQTQEKQRPVVASKGWDTPEIAALVEDFVENPATGMIHVPRQRMRNALVAAARIGAQRQAAIMSAADAATGQPSAGAASPFPPPRIVRGLTRLWLASLGLLALVNLPDYAQHYRNACYRSASYAPIGGNCGIVDGLINAVGDDAGYCALMALASWAAYRVALWVVRGFRAA
jgi:hypothetical protein